MKSNGNSSWSIWNVSLWLNNDYDLYNQARSLLSVFTIETAATEMLKFYLPKRTPDGAVYNRRNVEEFLKELKS